jgi:hypothetical protein
LEKNIENIKLNIKQFETLNNNTIVKPLTVIDDSNDEENDEINEQEAKCSAFSAFKLNPEKVVLIFYIF